MPRRLSIRSCSTCRSDPVDCDCRSVCSSSTSSSACSKGTCSESICVPCENFTAQDRFRFIGGGTCRNCCYEKKDHDESPGLWGRLKGAWKRDGAEQEDAKTVARVIVKQRPSREEKDEEEEEEYRERQRERRRRRRCSKAEMQMVKVEYPPPSPCSEVDDCSTCVDDMSAMSLGGPCEDDHHLVNYVDTSDMYTADANNWEKNNSHHDDRTGCGMKEYAKYSRNSKKGQKGNTDIYGRETELVKRRHSYSRHSRKQVSSKSKRQEILVHNPITKEGVKYVKDTYHESKEERNGSTRRTRSFTSTVCKETPIHSGCRRKMLAKSKELLQDDEEFNRAFIKYR